MEKLKSAYRKNRKKLQKLGFTLIEMLVVIAIIAVLVAIIVPTVTSSTTKAAAATNAANLRSIEGELSVLRVSNPDALYNSERQNVETIVNTVDGAIRGIINSFPDFEVIQALLVKLGSLAGDLASKNAFYATDGKLQLNGVVLDAPAAKALSVDGLDIPGTTEMQVVITEDDIIVTYAGMTAEAFAIIAGEGEARDYSTTAHTYYDANKDNTCDICNGGYPHTAEEIADGIIGGVVSGSHVCEDNDGDCACDDARCKLPMHVPDNKQICSKCREFLHTCVDEEDNSSWFGGGEPDGLCDICDNALAHDCYENNKNHVCDWPGCNKPYGDPHEVGYYANEGHMCSYCGTAVESHTADSTGTKCTGCDATRTLCGCTNYEAEGSCTDSTTCKNCKHAQHTNSSCTVVTKDWAMP